LTRAVVLAVLVTEALRLAVTVPKLRVAEVVSREHLDSGRTGINEISISTLPVSVTDWACKEGAVISDRMQRRENLYMDQLVREQDALTSTVNPSLPAAVISAQSHDAVPPISKSCVKSDQRPPAVPL